jgi:hypothetical protein
VNLEQLRYWNLDTTGTPALFADKIRREVEQVIELRRQIAAKPGMTAQDQTEKAYLLAKANAVANDLRDGANLLVASYFANVAAAEIEGLRQRLLLAFRSQADVSLKDAAVLPDFETFHPFHWELEFPEVFVDAGRGGFDAIVGNPPFLWGNRISSRLGDAYRKWLLNIHKKAHGNADLCVHLFLRAYQLIRVDSCIGLIATNSICETDNRISCLEPLLKSGATIIQALSGFKWTGAANLYISTVILRKGKFNGQCFLNGQKVSRISSFLDEAILEISPQRLPSQSEFSFKGVDTGGLGFIISVDERTLIAQKEPDSLHLIQPYLNGDDFLSNPDQKPSRLVINFTGMTEQEARQHKILIQIVEERVLPYRMTVKRKANRENWWLYNEPRPGLYSAISCLSHVIANCVVSKYICFNLVNSHTVFANTVNIFSSDSISWFCILQSSLHEVWARYYGSSLETRNRYNPTDCFETFPFPSSTSNLNEIGEKYYTHRQNIMLSRQEGLTKTYNRFHNPDETAADIQQLRSLHVEMDNAVAAAYGWQDIDLGHDFHETKQGLRYTISETARREVLDRLLLLNHQRYAEEVAQGLHDKGKKKGKSGGKTAKKQVSSEGQLSLF